MGANVDVEAQQNALPAPPRTEHDMQIDLSQRGHTPLQAEEGQIQAKAQTHNSAGKEPLVGPGPRNGTSDPLPEEERRMIGDFDGSANALWTLFGTEAKSHDEAQINSLKYGMDGVLIFAGLYSAALTAFVVDSKENLQVSPTDQMVYYLRQHSSILSQISQQLSSIAPEVSIPSAQPPPFPAFSPLASDIRINVLWFMALVFSLLAALLAILVQQWVRDYMHVFQQYSDPLKSARLRQYLHEGSKGWYMPIVAEAVPGLLHFSLFLFFAGLGNSLLNINTTVGLITIVPIGISSLLYIFITFAPIIYPQSPYQNSFSSVIWYLFQKLHGRQYRDRGSNGGWKPVSANMAEGQMQLAMEETEGRKGRDVQAIRWLVDSLTEDTEMEQFLMAIPGSFNTEWGVEVWKKLGSTIEDRDEDRSHNELVVGIVMDSTLPTNQSNHAMPVVIQPSYFGRAFRSIAQLVRKPISHYPTTHVTTLPAIVHPGEGIVHELSAHVARSLEACKNRGRFAKDDWQKRTRACIEITASLVCCADAKFARFGDIVDLLGDIGGSEKMRELSLAGTDQFFVMCWTCLSLLAIRNILERKRDVQLFAGMAVKSLAGEHDTGDDQAITGAQKIDKTFHNARKCLAKLHDVLPREENLTKAKEILRGNESKVSELENINAEADRLVWVDHWVFTTQSSIARQITPQFPGVLDDLDTAPVHFNRFVKQFRHPRKRQLVRPGQTLKSMCSLVPTLRNILEGQEDNDVYKELMKSLKEFRSGASSWQGNEMQRQLWRLQDLRDGGGLGFMVELFFFAFSLLSSTSPSKESHSALYAGTFRAITSGWSKHEHSFGTEKLLLDIALSRGWEFDSHYPAYIADEFLTLLGNIFDGQTGLHIDEAVEQLAPFRDYNPKMFRARAFKVFSLARAQSL